jgi:hypothetical protein
MPNPPIISLTDCTDPNAVARQCARLAALFGRTPEILPLSGADPEGTAALTLLDVLHSTELLGGAGEPTVILVNIAPRDGHWPNGVPFCYFRVREHLVISTFTPRVLEPLRRYLGVEAVEVTDVREAVEAAAAGWAEFTPAQVDEIARTQFRSLWYVPLLARWLVDGRPVPSRTEVLNSLNSAPTGATQPLARIAVVDNFGNCKLNLPADELTGYTTVRDGDDVRPRVRRDARGVLLPAAGGRAARRARHHHRQFRLRLRRVRRTRRIGRAAVRVGRGRHPARPFGPAQDPRPGLTRKNGRT